MNNPINLSYQVDIAEQGFINGDFIIQGTAINSVVTSNNHKFLSEELKKSAETLNGVPLLIDHNNSVSAIKGRVLAGEFNEVEEKVDFRAKVMDEQMKELIKDGRLNTVSVGAIVESIEEDGDFFIPRGITFKELSLVAVPADNGATFQIALKEAYNSNQLNKQEVKQMSEEQETETSTETSEEAKELKSEDKPTEEPKSEESEESEEAKLDNALKIARIKAKQKELKKLQEADEDEVPESKSKPEAKVDKTEVEDEEEDEEEVAEKYNVVRSSHNSFTLIR